MFDCYSSFRQRLAETHALMAEKELKQQEMYAKAARDLEEESKHWITLDNMDQKITEKLFEKPTTTGLTSVSSDLWRHHCYNITLGRLDHMDAMPKTAMDVKRQFHADLAVDKRMQAEEYLNTIIGKGEDRAKFAEYLNDYLVSESLNRDKSEEDQFDEVRNGCGDSVLVHFYANISLFVHRRWILF